jgi:hypothetical protein
VYECILSFLTAQTVIVVIASPPNLLLLPQLASLARLLASTADDRGKDFWILKVNFNFSK